MAVAVNNEKVQRKAPPENSKRRQQSFRASDDEFFRPLCLIRVIKTGGAFKLENSKCLIENE
jgi:hypothetical protein